MLLRRLQKDKHIQANGEAKLTLEAQMKQTTPLPSTVLQKSTKALIESRMSSSKILANEVTAQVAGLRLLVLPDKETGYLPVIEPNAKKEVDEAAEWDSGSVSDAAESIDESESEQQDLTMKEGESIEIGLESEEDSPAGEISGSQDLPPSKQQKTVESHVEEEEDYSSFLPSLAVGYTRGDSDASDWSGDDANSVTGRAIVPRKNRRGQRARQALV
jgi:BUD22